MSFPKVVIIILNYNGFPDTARCLKSVLKTDYPNFKVIVVDNGSETDESKILTKKFKDKRLQFVRFPKNLGFSGGNNKILRNITEKYAVLLNNDTEVTTNWLSPLVITLEKDPKIAVAQPKILWLTNKKYFDYAGASGGFIDIIGYPFTRGRIFDTKEIDKGQYNSLVDIFWASGAAMAIRTSIFKKIGYFDEIFFNYMEEIDLCFRIHKEGFRIICQPKSIIFHKVASTASKKPFKKRFYEHRNNLILIFKNYSAKDLLRIMPQRIFFEYVSFFYYVFTKKFSFALAVLASQVSILFMSVSILSKRNFKKSKYIYSDANHGFFNKSIVITYFLKGRRKFSELSMNE